MERSFNITHRQPQAVLSVRTTTTPEKLSEAIGDCLQTVGKYCAQSGVQQAGQPVTRIHRQREREVDVEAGLPVAQATAGSGRIEAQVLPGGQVVSMDHYGHYDGLTDARRELQDWLQQNGHQADGPSWEIYWTDPMCEADPNKWRTELRVAIKAT